MKVTGIDVRLARRPIDVAEGANIWQHVLENPQSLRRTHTDVVVVEIHTDQGISGKTMIYGGQCGRPAAVYFAEVLRPYLIGRDPRRTEEIARDMVLLDRFHAFQTGNLAGPLNVALWDIIGQQAGLPLWVLLGGARDRIPCYRSSEFLGSIEEYVSDALSTQAQNFAAYKLHPPRNRAGEIAACQAVREAVGPNFALMSDPVAAYTLNDAIAVGRALEDLNFKWFEEPLRDTDLRGYSELCRTLDIPIAATEFLPGGLHAIASHIVASAVDIVRADVSWKGGFNEFKKIASLAEAFGLNCEVHTAMISVLQVANLHAACSVLNCEFFEVADLVGDAWGTDWVLELDGDSCVSAPTRPGLGVSLDWDQIDPVTIESF